tara:strand:+ start:291 stop:407 length:117 start_codon:yes stop_codon:yes gene_type:complete
MFDAIIIVACLTFIFGIFYYVGETMFDELENNEEDGTE